MRNTVFSILIVNLILLQWTGNCKQIVTNSTTIELGKNVTEATTANVVSMTTNYSNNLNNSRTEINTTQNPNATEWHQQADKSTRPWTDNTDAPFSNFTTEHGTDTTRNRNITGDSETKSNNSIVLQTDLPDIISENNKGVVIAMSVFVVAIFSSCFIGVAVRRWRRKRRHKAQSVFYEEVEDAATSCSIEGSSNIKFLVGRSRNINKSRIEQINEDWMKEKPLLQNNEQEHLDEHTNGVVNTSDFDRCHSKQSSDDARRVIVEEEDSEYATAEPDEDLYSLAGGSDTDIVVNSDVPPPVPNIKRPSMKKLERVDTFDDPSQDVIEDPYSETAEDEYDNMRSPRLHKTFKPIEEFVTDDNAEDDDEEHMYETTDDVTYDTVDTAQSKEETIHRSKAQQELYRTSKNSQSEIYNASFEDEYDVLNKPRFRITVSSLNYDNVVLQGLVVDKEPDNSENKDIVENLEALVSKDRAPQNIYEDSSELDLNANDSEIENCAKSCENNTAPECLDNGVSEIKETVSLEPEEIQTFMQDEKGTTSSNQEETKILEQDEIQTLENDLNKNFLLSDSHGEETLVNNDDLTLNHIKQDPEEMINNNLSENSSITKHKQPDNENIPYDSNVMEENSSETPLSSIISNPENEQALLALLSKTSINDFDNKIIYFENKCFGQKLIEDNILEKSSSNS